MWILGNFIKGDGNPNDYYVLSGHIVGLVTLRSLIKYGKCSKISNTLKLRTPKIIAEYNF